METEIKENEQASDVEWHLKLDREKMEKSKVNGLFSMEERLAWCEEYIKILLEKKDESEAMHILDGKDISEMKQRLSKLEEDN